MVISRVKILAKFFFYVIWNSEIGLTIHVSDTSILDKYLSNFCLLFYHVTYHIVNILIKYLELCSEKR